MFSLAECAPRLAAAGARVRVLNCFTRTEHAPYRAPEDDRAAGTLRASEDRAAAALLGVVEVVDLDFEDAPGRLGVGVDQVCDPALPVDDALADALAAAMAADLARAHAVPSHDPSVPHAAPDAWLAAPLAPPGAHVDHRAAHAAARRLAAAGLRVVWYEDLPYATRVAAAEVAASAGGVARTLGTALVSLALACADGGRRKRAAVACYASQIEAGALDALADALDVSGERRGYAERLWVPLAASSGWMRALGA